MKIPDKRGVLLYGPKMIDIEAEPITKEEYDDLPSLFEYMVDVMRGFDVRGISAPEVGIFKNFFLLVMEDGSIKNFVNPEITRMWGHELLLREGCLSLPPTGNECLVPRMQHIEIEASTMLRPYVRERTQMSGSESRMAQHQMDHFTGTFFVERSSNSHKRKVLIQFNNWRHQKVVAEITEKENVCLKLSQTIRLLSRPT